jgi:hypothetical protein
MKRKEIENRKRKRKRKKTLPPWLGQFWPDPLAPALPPSPPTAHTAQPRAPRHLPLTARPRWSATPSYLPLASLSLAARARLSASSFRPCLTGALTVERLTPRRLAIKARTGLSDHRATVPEPSQSSFAPFPP